MPMQRTSLNRGTCFVLVILFDECFTALYRQIQYIRMHVNEMDTTP